MISVQYEVIQGHLNGIYFLCYMSFFLCWIDVIPPVLSVILLLCFEVPDFRLVISIVCVYSFHIVLVQSSDTLASLLT